MYNVIRNTYITDNKKSNGGVFIKTHKIYKFENGRITIQSNSFGYPELKVRVGNETNKLKCSYDSVGNVEKILEKIFELLKGESKNEIQ